MVPFDPHDKKYYSDSITFKKLYQKTLKNLPEGVTVAISKERDMLFNEEGNPVYRMVTLEHLQTKKEYCCEYYYPKEM